MLKDTGYLAYLDDGTDEGRSRAENVLELITVAQGYEGLSPTTFLEEVSLVSDVDTLGDESPAPSLLTLHSAKGLEFPVVSSSGWRRASCRTSARWTIPTRCRRNGG